MRSHPEWLRELSKRMGCRREYWWYGRDMYCHGVNYLVRALGSSCTVRLTYQALREAERFRPRLLVIDPYTLERYAELRYEEWLALLYGYSDREIYIVPRRCKLKIEVQRYQRGREIRIVVSPETYEKWVRFVRDKKKPWEDLLLELLRRAGY